MSSLEIPLSCFIVTGSTGLVAAWQTTRCDLRVCLSAGVHFGFIILVSIGFAHDQSTADVHLSEENPQTLHFQKNAPLK